MPTYIDYTDIKNQIPYALEDFKTGTVTRPDDELFSVIIPAVDGDRSLQYTLGSLKAQKGVDNKDVIVATTGPPRKSIQMAEEHGARIMYDPSPDYAHINGARNYGGEKATGKWVAFLDCGAMLEENALEVAANTLANGNKGGTCKIFDTDSGLNAIVRRIVHNTWAKWMGPLPTPFVYTDGTTLHKINGWYGLNPVGASSQFLARIRDFSGPITFNTDTHVTLPIKQDRIDIRV